MTHFPQYPAVRAGDPLNCIIGPIGVYPDVMGGQPVITYILGNNLAFGNKLLDVRFCRLQQPSHGDGYPISPTCKLANQGDKTEATWFSPSVTCDVRLL